MEKMETEEGERTEKLETGGRNRNSGAEIGTNRNTSRKLQNRIGKN